MPASVPRDLRHPGLREGSCLVVLVMTPDQVFRRCTGFTLGTSIEGGFVDDPSDPGGPTNEGVSLRAVVGLDDDGDGNLDFDLDKDGDVDIADIRLVSKFPDQRDAFYRRRYYDPLR